MNLPAIAPRLRMFAGFENFMLEKRNNRKTMFKKLFAIGFIFLFLAFSVFAQREVGVRPTASGGVLMPEQAAYDVLSYDLDLRPDIAAQTIKGVLTVKAKIVKPIDKFV